MDKYVLGLHGSCSIINWITTNKAKYFLDMVTMSDIAYTVAVIKNSYDAWDEVLVIMITNKSVYPRLFWPGLASMCELLMLYFQHFPSGALISI